MALDLRTAVITAFTTILLMPLLALTLRILARHGKVWIEAAADGILFWTSRFVLHGVAARVSLKAYCRLLLAATRYVPVPSTRDITLEIDKIFVGLNLENAGSSQKTFSHTDLLTAGNRVRLVGDPGSGKSCLTKRLLRDTAQNALRHPRTARLPVLYELRHVAIPSDVPDDALGEWLYMSLRSQTEKVNVHRMGECFDSYAAQSGLLVLLDGLDEIASDRYQRTQKAICQLSALLHARGANNAVIVTTRTQFHQQIRAAYTDAFPNVLHLKAFSPSDIYEFLTRWPFRDDPRPRMNRIYRDLTDRPTLRELCGNPLILSMYVAEADGPADQLVPDSRTEFYSRVCDELLVNRRVRQLGQHSGRSALRDLREQVLGSLAFEHMLDTSQPANSLLWRKGIEVVKLVCKVEASDAEQMLLELGRETGLFTTERAGESFRFMHLTLCEFFAAVHAVKNRPTGWKDLIARQHELANDALPQTRTRLFEVIPFACGLQHAVNRATAVSDVVELGDNRLLLRCLLETKAYNHRAWSRVVVEQRERLIAVPERWDDDWLFDFHLFNVAARDAATVAKAGVPIQDTVDLDAFLQEVVATHVDGLAQLIDRYAEKDAAAVFRVAEVAGIDLGTAFPNIVVQNCDQRPFMELILERLPVDEPSQVMRWANILTEAGLRSRAVAADLTARPPLMAWARIADSTHRRYRWTMPGVVAPSLYSQCLTLAAASTEPAFDLVEQLRRIPAPGAYRWLLSRFTPVVLGVALMGIVSFLFLDLSAIRRDVGVMSPGHQFPYYLYSLGIPLYIVMFMAMRVRFLYAELAQSTPASTRTPSLFRTWLMRALVPPGLRASATDLLVARSRIVPADGDATTPSGSLARDGVTSA